MGEGGEEERVKLREAGEVEMLARSWNSGTGDRRMDWKRRASVYSWLWVRMERKSVKLSEDWE